MALRTGTRTPNTPLTRPKSTASPELVDLSKRLAGGTPAAPETDAEPTLTDRYAADREAIETNAALNVDEPSRRKIREQYRQMAQGSVDAIRSTFDKFIAEDTQAKRDLESKAYLGTLASGLSGSPTGAAQTTAAATKGEEKVRATIAERDAKIEEVLGAADLRASEEFNARRAEYLNSAADRATAEETLRQRINDTALGELELLASTGSFDDVTKKSPGKMEQYMAETGMDETALRAFFLSRKKSNLLSDKPEIIGNKAVWFSLDPATGKVTQEAIDLPASKEIKDSRITDAGIQVLYNDGTYDVIGGAGVTQPGGGGTGPGGSPYGNDLDALIGTTLSTIPTKFGQATFRDQVGRARNDGDKINIIAAMVLKGAPAEFKRDFANQAVGVSEIDKAIKLIDSGVQTGVLQSGAQYTYNLAGRDFDPKLAQIQQHITGAIQPYRNSVTGAAWGDQEDAEYASLFGDIHYSPTELKQRLQGVKEILKSKSVSGLNAYVNPLGTYGSPFETGNLTPDGGDLRSRAEAAGYDYEAMKADGLSDEDIAASL